MSPWAFQLMKIINEAAKSWDFLQTCKSWIYRKYENLREYTACASTKYTKITLDHPRCGILFKTKFADAPGGETEPPGKVLPVSKHAKLNHYPCTKMTMRLLLCWPRTTFCHQINRRIGSEAASCAGAPKWVHHDSKHTRQELSWHKKKFCPFLRWTYGQAATLEFILWSCFLQISHTHAQWIISHIIRPLLYSVFSLSSFCVVHGSSFLLFVWQCSVGYVILSILLKHSCLIISCFELCGAIDIWERLQNARDAAASGSQNGWMGGTLWGAVWARPFCIPTWLCSSAQNNVYQPLTSRICSGWMDRNSQLIYSNIMWKVFKEKRKLIYLQREEQNRGCLF